MAPKDSFYKACLSFLSDGRKKGKAKPIPTDLLKTRHRQTKKMASNFTFHEATMDDVEAIARIMALAFVDDFSNLKYGFAPFERRCEIFRPYIKGQMENPKAPFFVIRDDENGGRIVAFAQWSLPDDPDQKKGEEERRELRWMSAPEKAKKRKEAEEHYEETAKGMNAPLLAEFEDIIGLLHDDTMQGRKAYVLVNLCCDPSYQRLGAATRLARWPFKKADEEGVFCYVDTHVGGSGEQLYRKLGFRQMIRRTVPKLERFGGQGESSYVSFVRWPLTSQKTEDTEFTFRRQG